MQESTDNLTTEYETWVKSKDYPYLSADELLAQTTGDDETGEECYVVVDESDRAYLNDFVARWENASTAQNTKKTYNDIRKEFGLEELEYMSRDDLVDKVQELARALVDEWNDNPNNN